jgi:hypothetical protein
VRRRLLFRGDKECYNKAKLASDGFEHGFLDFTKIHTHAMETRNTVAEYLRSAILDLVGDDAGKIVAVRVGRYREVLGAFPIVKYFRGVLLGEGPRLASEGQEYPMLAWKSKIKSVRRTDDGPGGYQIIPDETMTARFGEGISLRPVSFEVWGPKEKTEGSNAGTEESG